MPEDEVKKYLCRSSHNDKINPGKRKSADKNPCIHNYKIPKYSPSEVSQTISSILNNKLFKDELLSKPRYSDNERVHLQNNNVVEKRINLDIGSNETCPKPSIKNAGTNCEDCVLKWNNAEINTYSRIHSKRKEIEGKENIAVTTPTTFTSHDGSKELQSRIPRIRNKESETNYTTLQDKKHAELNSVPLKKRRRRYTTNIPLQSMWESDFSNIMKFPQIKSLLRQNYRKFDSRNRKVNRRNKDVAKPYVYKCTKRKNADEEDECSTAAKKAKYLTSVCDESLESDETINRNKIIKDRHASVVDESSEERNSTNTLATGKESRKLINTSKNHDTKMKNKKSNGTEHTSPKLPESGNDNLIINEKNSIENKAVKKCKPAKKEVRCFLCCKSVTVRKNSKLNSTKHPQRSYIRKNVSNVIYKKNSSGVDDINDARGSNKECIKSSEIPAKIRTRRNLQNKRKRDSNTEMVNNKIVQNVTEETSPNTENNTAAKIRRRRSTTVIELPGTTERVSSTEITNKIEGIGRMQSKSGGNLIKEDSSSIIASQRTMERDSVVKKPTKLANITNELSIITKQKVKKKSGKSKTIERNITNSPELEYDSSYSHINANYSEKEVENINKSAVVCNTRPQYISFGEALKMYSNKWSNQKEDISTDFIVPIITSEVGPYVDNEQLKENQTRLQPVPKTCSSIKVQIPLTNIDLGAIFSKLNNISNVAKNKSENRKTVSGKNVFESNYNSVSLTPKAQNSRTEHNHLTNISSTTDSNLMHLPSAVNGSRDQDTLSNKEQDNSTSNNTNNLVNSAKDDLNYKAVTVELQCHLRTPENIDSRSENGSHNSNFKTPETHLITSLSEQCNTFVQEADPIDYAAFVNNKYVIDPKQQHVNEKSNTSNLVIPSYKELDHLPVLNHLNKHYSEAVSKVSLCEQNEKVTSKSPNHSTYSVHNINTTEFTSNVISDDIGNLPGNDEGIRNHLRKKVSAKVNSDVDNTNTSNKTCSTVRNDRTCTDIHNIAQPHQIGYVPGKDEGFRKHIRKKVSAKVNSALDNINESCTFYNTARDSTVASVKHSVITDDTAGKNLNANILPNILQCDNTNKIQISGNTTRNTSTYTNSVPSSEATTITGKPPLIQNLNLNKNLRDLLRTEISSDIVLTSKECADRIKDAFVTILHDYNRYIIMRQDALSFGCNTSSEELQLISEFFTKSYDLHTLHLYNLLTSVKVVDFTMKTFLEELITKIRIRYGTRFSKEMLMDTFLFSVSTIKNRFPSMVNKCSLWEQIHRNTDFIPSKTDITFRRTENGLIPSSNFIKLIEKCIYLHDKPQDTNSGEADKPVHNNIDSNINTTPLLEVPVSASNMHTVAQKNVLNNRSNQLLLESSPEPTMTVQCAVLRNSCQYSTNTSPNLENPIRILENRLITPPTHLNTVQMRKPLLAEIVPISSNSSTGRTCIISPPNLTIPDQQIPDSSITNINNSKPVLHNTKTVQQNTNSVDQATNIQKVNKSGINENGIPNCDSSVLQVINLEDSDSSCSEHILDLSQFKNKQTGANLSTKYDKAKSHNNNHAQDKSVQLLAEPLNIEHSFSKTTGISQSESNHESNRTTELNSNEPSNNKGDQAVENNAHLSSTSLVYYSRNSPKEKVTTPNRLNPRIKGRSSLIQEKNHLLPANTIPRIPQYPNANGHNNRQQNTYPNTNYWQMNGTPATRSLTNNVHNNINHNYNQYYSNYYTSYPNYYNRRANPHFQPRNAYPYPYQNSYGPYYYNYGSGTTPRRSSEVHHTRTVLPQTKAVIRDRNSSLDSGYVSPAHNNITNEQRLPVSTYVSHS